MTSVHAELRSVADAYLRVQRQGHTLQPTALVHEAFLRLFAHQDVRWNDRKHFYAMAAKAITNFGDLRYTGWGGGVPLYIGDEVVGAIGISGLPEAVDMQLAADAAAALSS